jgi:hypothetical protein
MGIVGLEKSDFYWLLFRVTDSDENGSVSFEEFWAAIKDKNLMDKVKALYLKDQKVKQDSHLDPSKESQEDQKKGDSERIRKIRRGKRP